MRGELEPENEELRRNESILGQERRGFCLNQISAPRSVAPSSAPRSVAPSSAPRSAALSSTPQATAPSRLTSEPGFLAPINWVQSSI